MFSNLHRDAKRYVLRGGWAFSLGFWVVAIHRARVWAFNIPIPGLRHLLNVFFWLIQSPLYVILHVELPRRANIGPGLLLMHPYNIIIGPTVELGAECTVYHEVTIGSSAIPGLPKLCDGVVVFSGAKVLGEITVGEHAEIGANSVLFRDVPAWTQVVSAPSRLIPQSLSQKFSAPVNEDG